LWGAIIWSWAHRPIREIGSCNLALTAGVELAAEDRKSLDRLL
jgi:hypothetical protein